MVKHIVAYNYAEGFTEEENRRNVQKMRAELEALVGIIDGLITLKLYDTPMETSEFDLLLYSELESEEALRAYAIHPEHVRVAANYVRPFISGRKCMDFTVS
ncbi:hypothetical protein HNQ56_001791 [Anaerotaenia torta]|uniref:Dabb family protein n=1 Tax=Anaerotaenia torta TaxID=433293 RepID=UPI003D1B2788